MVFSRKRPRLGLQSTAELFHTGLKFLTWLLSEQTEETNTPVQSAMERDGPLKWNLQCLEVAEVS